MSIHSHVQQLEKLRERSVRTVMLATGAAGALAADHLVAVLAAIALEAVGGLVGNLLQAALSWPAVLPAVVGLLALGLWLRRWYGRGTADWALLITALGAGVLLLARPAPALRWWRMVAAAVIGLALAWQPLAKAVRPLLIAVTGLAVACLYFVPSLELGLMMVGALILVVLAQSNPRPVEPPAQPAAGGRRAGAAQVNANPPPARRGAPAVDRALLTALEVQMAEQAWAVIDQAGADWGNTPGAALDIQLAGHSARAVIHSQNEVRLHDLSQQWVFMVTAGAERWRVVVDLHGRYRRQGTGGGIWEYLDHNRTVMALA